MAFSPYINAVLPAGAGKSKLVTTVVDDFQKTIGNRKDTELMAYFYCDRNQQDRRMPESVLSSFVRQLSTSSTGDAIQPYAVYIYEEKEKLSFASNKLKLEETQRLLLDLVNTYPQTTLILDALDECDKDTRSELVKVFDALLRDSSNPIKIFISSRPDSDIRDHFERGPNLEIQATHNQGDIASFVDQRMRESPRRWHAGIYPELRDEVCRTILEKSNGMCVDFPLKYHDSLKIS